VWDLANRTRFPGRSYLRQLVGPTIKLASGINSESGWPPWPRGFRFPGPISFANCGIRAQLVEGVAGRSRSPSLRTFVVDMGYDPARVEAAKAQRVMEPVVHRTPEPIAKKGL